MRRIALYLTPVVLLIAGACGLVFFFLAGGFWGFLCSLVVAVLGWCEIDVTRVSEQDAKRFQR